MKVISLLACIAVFTIIPKSVSAQDTIFPKSSLIHLNSFSYRLITQEYITNENDYFLDVKNDTCYLLFKQESEDVYRFKYTLDDKGVVPLKTTDTLKKMVYRVRFDANGKIAELVNWQDFRDVVVSGLSAQVRGKIITSSEFDERKAVMNQEKIIRRIAMEDIGYLFSLNGDTMRLDAEYIRVKPVRSPFTGEDYYFAGFLKAEKPEGAKNTILFTAQNKAGAEDKPQLLNECKEYLQKNLPPGQPASELQAIGLNSEQSFQYNKAQQRMIKVTLSDVLAINTQSRGNIRIYNLWDLEE